MENTGWNWSRSHPSNQPISSSSYQFNPHLNYHATLTCGNTYATKNFHSSPYEASGGPPNLEHNKEREWIDISELPVPAQVNPTGLTTNKTLENKENVLLKERNSSEERSPLSRYILKHTNIGNEIQVTRETQEQETNEQRGLYCLDQNAKKQRQEENFEPREMKDYSSNGQNEEFSVLEEKIEVSEASILINEEKPKLAGKEVSMSSNKCTTQVKKETNLQKRQENASAKRVYEETKEPSRASCLEPTAKKQRKEYIEQISYKMLEMKDYCNNEQNEEHSVVEEKIEVTEPGILINEDKPKLTEREFLEDSSNLRKKQENSAAKRVCEENKDASEDNDEDWAVLNVEEDKSEESEESEDDNSDVPAKFKCPHCKYKTDWKNNMTKHVISRHKAASEITWFDCAHCSYKGKTREYLITHLRQHHEKSVEWHKCSQCSFKAKFKTGLKHHIISFHTPPEDIKWWPCEECPFKGKFKVALKNHVKSMHQRKKFFQCEVCERILTTSKGLKRHYQRKHSKGAEVEWYRCGKCTFKANSTLKVQVHLKSWHPREDASNYVVINGAGRKTSCVTSNL